MFTMKGAGGLPERNEDTIPKHGSEGARSQRDTCPFSLGERFAKPARKGKRRVFILNGVCVCGGGLDKSKPYPFEGTVTFAREIHTARLSPKTDIL